MNPRARLAELAAPEDASEWRPRFFDLSCEPQRSELEQLLADGKVLAVHDRIRAQLESATHSTE